MVHSCHGRMLIANSPAKFVFYNIRNVIDMMKLLEVPYRLSHFLSCLQVIYLLGDFSWHQLVLRWNLMWYQSLWPILCIAYFDRHCLFFPVLGSILYICWKISLKKKSNWIGWLLCYKFGDMLLKFRVFPSFFSISMKSRMFCLYFRMLWLILLLNCVM